MQYPGPARRYIWAHRDPFLGLVFCLLLMVLCACEPAPPLLPDTEAPRLLGLGGLTVEAGGTILYRDGVSAVDDVDGPVPLQIDAGAVDLNKAGVYPVIYSAVDAAGNAVSKTVAVVVTASDEDQDGPFAERLETITKKILAEITTEEMDQREKARAIFDYVHDNIHYAGSSNKRSWVRAAYTGFTRGIGDCFNYFACSKALLTQAGIENVDLQRVGGVSQHFWQLVNVGDGWYHFDACPTPKEYGLDAFLFTEAQARAFTEMCAGDDRYPNYYVYDYAACPVQPESMPEDGEAAAE